MYLRHEAGHAFNYAYLEVVAFATTLAMNYLTRGGFTEH